VRLIYFVVSPKYKKILSLIKRNSQFFLKLIHTWSKTYVSVWAQEIVKGQEGVQRPGGPVRGNGSMAEKGKHEDV